MNGNNKGFTLIELSIVLVIIGLIVGGVLVGQDLIKGAEIRATAGQIERIDAAANTFRNKYNGLPGDILNPTNFGLSDTGLTPNGNGKIDNAGAMINALFYINNEGAAFFRHLSQTSLISENINAQEYSAPFASGETIADYFLKLKISGTYVTPLAWGAVNYYYVHRNATGLVADPGFVEPGSGFGIPELTAIDSYQLDTKMDDGIANKGRVAYNDIPVGGNTSSDDLCQTAGTYNFANDATNGAYCRLRIRASF